MTQPNFVFIMTDSQGANDISAYGNCELQTTHIDRLAARGTRFEYAYSSSPICGPARAGIFTGQYPHSAGTWANEMPLLMNTKTMGQRFRDHGYQTAYVGKWHLSGQDYFDTGVCPDGWDDAYWYDGRRYLADLSEDDVRLWRQVLSTTAALKHYDIQPAFTWGHRISDRAIRFLSEQHTAPFLLALSYDEPHGPCTCPKEYVERWEDYRWDPGPNKHDDMHNKPTMHRAMQQWGTTDLTPDGLLNYPPFFACNQFVDDEIGRVLEAVDCLAPENTYIIFTSDHGQFKGAHGLNGKGLAMYEESSRIPLIIRAPLDLHAGRVDHSLVSHVDILPTMLELAGFPVPPILEGASLKQNLLKGQDTAEKNAVIEWNRADLDSHGNGGFFPVRCLRQQTYKLVINLYDIDEFYNLSDDPHEMNNRIDDVTFARERDEMHDQLIAWMNDTRDPFRGVGWTNRPWHHSDHFQQVGGKTRPDDGYLPPTLDYWTAQVRPEWREGWR